MVGIFWLDPTLRLFLEKKKLWSKVSVSLVTHDKYSKADTSNSSKEKVLAETHNCKQCLIEF